MAALLADEHFDVRACSHLRKLGHDVLLVRAVNLSKSGDGWSDQQVLEYAISTDRALITDNIRDFRLLHNVMHWHAGIIACAFNRDARAKAKRIDRAIREFLQAHGSLAGQWIVVAKPPDRGRRGGRSG
jgi:hypothetical protein